jgi:hypothetical protein
MALSELVGLSALLSRRGEPKYGDEKAEEATRAQRSAAYMIVTNDMTL